MHGDCPPVKFRVVPHPRKPERPGGGRVRQPVDEDPVRRVRAVGTTIARCPPTRCYSQEPAISARPIAVAPMLGVDRAPGLSQGGRLPVIRARLVTTAGPGGLTYGMVVSVKPPLGGEPGRGVDAGPTRSPASRSSRSRLPPAPAQLVLLHQAFTAGLLAAGGQVDPGDRPGRSCAARERSQSVPGSRADLQGAVLKRLLYQVVDGSYVVKVDRARATGQSTGSTSAIQAFAPGSCFMTVTPSLRLRSGGDGGPARTMWRA